MGLFDDLLKKAGAMTQNAVRTGFVKAKTGDSTPQSVYDNWFKSVYLPSFAAAAASQTATS